LVESFLGIRNSLDSRWVSRDVLLLPESFVISAQERKI
jgi:hypothetical protein